MRASTDSLQTALGATQFGVSYPGGAEACKLGLETTLINSQHAFLWIDSTNAIYRLLIKEAVTLLVAQPLRRVLQDQDQVDLRTDANTAGGAREPRGADASAGAGRA